MDNELTSSPQAIAPRRELHDLRSRAMTCDTKTMQAALDQYIEQRKKFREWLLAQLVPGVHYGYPPGTEPRTDGDYTLVWSKSAGRDIRVPHTQWAPKPSMYKAGAEFVVDLNGIRVEYVPDDVASRVFSGDSKPPVIVIIARLFSRVTGELLGEGRGARKLGTKGGDENNTIKMAQKSALVDAVLTAYGLSDLFSQDLEDARPAHVNPAADPSAPDAEPRGQRLSSDALAAMKGKVTALIAEWRTTRKDAEATVDHWRTFVQEACWREFKVSDPREWKQSDVKAVQAKIAQILGAPQ